MCEGSMPLAAFALGGAMADGEGPARGAHHLNGGIAPFQTYAVKDGYVALAALEPKFWQAFCAGVGIACDPDALVPGEHQTALREALAGIFAQRTRAEWEAFARAHDCCLEPVLELAELPNDPQHIARGVFFSLEGMHHMRVPIGARHEHTSARAAGADTDMILREAGESDESRADLAARGVIQRG
jgi:crotonobetainyl-CoA:carnitine CoA-transferase CaiB-like acyl-CoA transferase